MQQNFNQTDTGLSEEVKKLQAFLNEQWSEGGEGG